MNILLLIEDLDRDQNLFKQAETFLNSNPTLHITFLYITDGDFPLSVECGTHPHYLLPDAELRYKNEVEDFVSKTFSPWYTRIHFRHEVGHTMNIVQRLVDELKIDFIAINRTSEYGFGLNRVKLAKALLDVVEHPVFVAN